MSRVFIFSVHKHEGLVFLFESFVITWWSVGSYMKRNIQKVLCYCKACAFYVIVQ